MADPAIQPPVYWISRGGCIGFHFLEEGIRRAPGSSWDLAIQHRSTMLSALQSPNKQGLWSSELFYVRQLHYAGNDSEYDCNLFGRILCQALAIPQDCHRSLLPNEDHCLTLYTNQRTIQVYCSHNTQEKTILEDLVVADSLFRKNITAGDNWGEKSYEQFLEPKYRKALPLLAWETIFPEGIDMEALSPRDANARIRVKQLAPKPKSTVKQSQKEKDHPPPPPREVYEPPSSDRKNGAVYQTGQLLGKGGFAICYEGKHAGTKQLVALKIVRSHMPQKKMEQKFQTELQIHSKMNHRNIVQFHRAFSYEQCTYIVLELCPNGSLMDLVKKRKYVTEPEVRFWTVQMAGAIKYMHNKGIIHRDLKMGNIFLDKNMNVKIGDFGLAALLMSGKDWNACRRTTLCGTPNYIAPEIVSKDKQGHDHAVDIWSLGIIIFALLTGRPPFQSATADEIYRRARDRDYDWPKLDTSENFISQETKDLVAILLQEAEKRPDPDTIVQHPFFVAGWMPQPEEMTPSLKERHPKDDQFLSVGIRGGRANLYARNLKELCMTCEVGPWNAAKPIISTYREVAAEEKAGLTPAVPLPENVVYRPFNEWLREQAKQVVENGEDVIAAGEAFNKILEPLPASRGKSSMIPSARPATQSFAAQQRTRPQGSIPGPSSRSTQGSAAEPSSRPLLNIGSRQQKSNPRKTESRSIEEPADVEDRLAADLVKQLGKIEKERKAQEVEMPANLLDEPATLFGPTERLETLPNSKPDIVLERLRRLHTELERALNSRSMALEPDYPPPSSSLVVKWVDYTNKFGLGYILSNGSVGCIFKKAPAIASEPEKGIVPPSCIVVRDAERHLQQRNNKSYPDRHQLVPIRGPNIEFYENRGEKGISRGKVNPMKYKVSDSSSGEFGRLSRGDDDWDDRKREKIVLWKKFANYMTAFGRDQDYPFDDALIRNVDPQPSTGNLITFYQRFGDVGVWGFHDGHFQFNFPDHTKIVLSADGIWCDFYHLPLEAAHNLAKHGHLPTSALDDRGSLSHPLQTLLNFMSKPSRSNKYSVRKRPEISPVLQGIPQANDFRRKVEFVRLIVKEWISNRGLGNSSMDPKDRLRWDGSRELTSAPVKVKHVWVTVGARGGDDRRVAWFDPRKPLELNPDIE